MNFTWESQFAELFQRCLDRYNSGDTDFANYYSEDDLAFLKSIGYQTREFFDFVEDCGDANGGEPTPGTALLVAAVRRDFLKVIQKGQPSDRPTLKPDDLPARDSELGGFIWLPRIIAKARGKLHGVLDPDIMYSCGGDRGFLSKQDIHPADFLRVVSAAGDDDQKILAYVQANLG